MILGEGLAEEIKSGLRQEEEFAWARQETAATTVESRRWLVSLTILRSKPS